MQIISIGPRVVIGSETVTVSTTAIGLTSTKYKVAAGSLGDRMYAKEAFVTVEDNQVRWNLDPAVTVTASTNGHEADAGDSFSIHGVTAMDNFRAIRTGGADGVLRISYLA